MPTTLTVKPFGASGVRLLFSAGRGSTLELRLPHDGAEWQPHGEPLVDDEGVVVVKSLDGGAPSPWTSYACEGDVVEVARDGDGSWLARGSRRRARTEEEGTTRQGPGAAHARYMSFLHVHLYVSSYIICYLLSFHIIPYYHVL